MFFLMIRRPPRSTRTDHSFPTRRSSDLSTYTSFLLSYWGRDRIRNRIALPQIIHMLTAKPAALMRMRDRGRSEEHTSELQSLMRISYAVFCLKKKKQKKENTHQPKKQKKTKTTGKES